MVSAETGDLALNLAVPIREAPPRAASLGPLAALVACDLDKVNELILSRAGSEVALIPEIANHLISSGGKRLRPMLTLAMAALDGYRGDAHVKLAASVEFMHTATLLHDDVVDESELRRGHKTARVVWGNQASVLVGDFLLGQAFRMMVEAGFMEALDILSCAAAVIAEGEVMQLATAKNLATDEKAYLAVTGAKTAELFAAACEVGPAIAGQGQQRRRACRDFGMALGQAFQLVDDALDYGGSSVEFGKKVGDDFREGKITLPVILAFGRADAEECAFWRRVMEQLDQNDGDLDRAIALLRHHGAIEATIARAHRFGEEARRALSAYPDSQLRRALDEAVDFAIERSR
jgi:octaprenyl-diphosphate synthase